MPLEAGWKGGKAHEKREVTWMSRLEHAILLELMGVCVYLGTSTCIQFVFLQNFGHPILLCSHRGLAYSEVFNLNRFLHRSR